MKPFAGEPKPAAAFRAWTEGHAFTLDRAAEAPGLSRRTVACYLSGEQPVPKTVMLATEGYDGRRREGVFPRWPGMCLALVHSVPSI